MALATTYSTGTASVNANSTAVTGQGTTWLTSGIQAGDLFWAAGLEVRIAAVNTNTSLTLAFAWPGASRSVDTYELQYAPDITRALGAARQLLDTLGNGNLTSIAALTSAANTFAYFTGSGTSGLATLTAHARALLALSGGAGKFLRSTGTSTIVMQDIVGTVAQSSGTPTGAIVERGSNANGDYVRFADGTQMCWATASIGDVTTASGGLYISPVQTFTFAATFSASGGALAVSGSATSGSGRYLAYDTASSTSINYRVVGPVSGAAAGTVRHMAVGRWF